MRFPGLLAAICCLPYVALGVPPSSFGISGVPIYNYDTTAVGAMSGDKKSEWIVVMKSGSSDAQVHALCSGGTGCVSESHPSKGDLAFVTVEATLSELEDMVKKNPGDMEFVEKSLPVFIPPSETASLVVDSDGLSSFGSTNPHGNITLLDTDQPAYGHFVMTCCPVIGYGPYRSYQAADLKFGAVQRSASQAIMTSERASRAQRCASDCNGEPQKSLWRTWWECKVGLKSGAGCAAPPAPTPSPTRAPPGPSPPGGGGQSGPTGPEAPSPAPTSLWGLDRIDDLARRDGTYGAYHDGRGVHVYVVDTGIRTTHSDFGGRAIPTIDTSTGKVEVCDAGDTSCAMDKNGHGSHCAGTVGGVKFGVAKAVTLHAVRVMNDAGEIYTSRITLAMDWIATNAIRPALMSVSLGADGNSPAMRKVVDKAVGAGITVVVASGNDNYEACKQTPANVLSALVVGATSKTDSRSDYSNFGSCLDIFAPGDNILSAGRKNDNEQVTMSGTSMATPHVSGAVAMLLQTNPNMQPAEVIKELQGYANKGIVRDAKTGSPNFLLRVTLFTTTTTTQAPGSSRRRKSNGSSARRRRRRSGSSRRRKSSRRRRRRSQ